MTETLASSLVRRSSMQIGKADYVGAFATLVEAFSMARDDPELLRQIAIDLGKIGQFGVAREVWVELRRSKPNDATVQLGVFASECAIARDIHDLSRLKTDLDQFLNTTKLDIDQKLTASTLYQKCRDIKAAIKIIDKPRSVSDDYRISLRLARLFSFTKAKRKAVRELKKVLVMTDVPKSVLHECGVLARELASSRVAEAFARRHFALAPNDLIAVEHLCTELLATKKSTEMRALLSDLLHRHRAERVPVVTLVKIATLYRAANVPDGEQLFLERAVAENPEHPLVMEALNTFDYLKRHP